MKLLKHKDKSLGLKAYVDKILALKSYIGSNLLALGGLLMEIRDQELWKETSDGWKEFLGMPEISISEGHASQMIKVWEVFKDFSSDKLEGVDHYKLYLIADKVNDEPDKAEAWIDDARQLSRSDLKVKLGKQREHQPLEERIDEFLEEIQPEPYIVDRNKDNWRQKFKKLILAWEGKE